MTEHMRLAPSERKALRWRPPARLSQRWYYSIGAIFHPDRSDAFVLVAEQRWI